MLQLGRRQTEREEKKRLTSGGLISARTARGEARGALVGMAAADEHLQLLGDAVWPLEGLSDAGPFGGNHPIQLPVHREQVAVQR